MSQQEVIKLLEKYGKEAISIKEMAEELKGKMNLISINRCIKTMYKFGEVDYIELNFKQARKRYGKNIKRKMRIYFIK